MCRRTDSERSFRRSWCCRAVNPPNSMPGDACTWPSTAHTTHTDAASHSRWRCEARSEIGAASDRAACFTRLRCSRFEATLAESDASNNSDQRTQIRKVLRFVTGCRRHLLNIPRNGPLTDYGLLARSSVRTVSRSTNAGAPTASRERLVLELC